MRYEFLAEVWFIDGLKQLAIQEGRPLNRIIRDALLKEYPQLEELGQSYERHLLRKTKSVEGSGPPAGDALPPAVAGGGGAETTGLTREEASPQALKKSILRRLMKETL